MKTISTEQSKIIDAAATRIVELPARVLEKDVIITEALRAIAAVRTAGLTLTFSGGTCLAKAYKLLERMSEDIDLRVSLENPGNFTRSGVRTCLRKLKIAVTDAMRAMQFHIPDTAIRARNENQFMSFEVQYASRYPQEKSLRPSLRIELMAIAPRRATTTLNVRPLIDELTGRVTAEPVALACLSIEETYCEKIISYLRRATEFLSGRERPQYNGRLARHVYDVHRIVTLRYPQAIISPPVHLFREILVAEAVQYGNRDARFAEGPARTLQATLARIAQRREFRDHYEQFAAALVYGDSKPTFDEGFETFRAAATSLLVHCENHGMEPELSGDEDSHAESTAIH